MLRIESFSPTGLLHAPPTLLYPYSAFLSGLIPYYFMAILLDSPCRIVGAHPAAPTILPALPLLLCRDRIETKDRMARPGSSTLPFIRLFNSFPTHANY